MFVDSFQHLLFNVEVAWDLKFSPSKSSIVAGTAMVNGIPVEWALCERGVGQQGVTRENVTVFTLLMTNGVKVTK